MTKLADLQTGMLKAIHGQPNAMLSEVVGAGFLSRAERLQIYQESVRAARINALMSTFSQCCECVGDAFFSAMSAVYIEKTPSRSPDLNDDGEYFPAFIQAFAPAQALPFLAALARLEWAWHCVSRVEPSQPIDLTAIADLSEQALASVRFRLPAGAHLLDLEYPVQTLWSLESADHGSDHLLEQVSATSIGVKWDVAQRHRVTFMRERVQLLVFRDQTGRRMDRLDEPFFTLLQSLQSAQTFSEMSEHFCASYCDDDFVEAFTVCCQQGWIAGVM